MLKQPQCKPLSQHEQVMMLVVVLHHIIQDIPEREIGSFIQSMLSHFEQTHSELCRRIDETGQLTDDDKVEIILTAKAFSDNKRN